MSNLWRLKQKILIDDLSSVRWPALLKAELDLEPHDFFERKETTGAKVAIFGETKFDFHPGDAKISIANTGAVGPLEHNIELPFGKIEIRGSKAFVSVQVESMDFAVNFIDWIRMCFSQMLSFELGIYCTTRLTSGTIADRPFSLAHPGLAYCLLVNHAEPEDRYLSLNAAFTTIDPGNPSYPRFLTACLYYQHALRLLSPHEVNFSIYTAAAEVILNLEKCIFSLFPSKTRDILEKKLVATLGYSQSEVKSQLISILIIRNEFDVGHSSSGAIDGNEIDVLRKFIARAVGNVWTLLHNVASKIKDEKLILEPLSRELDGENKRRLRRLTESLEQPPLSPRPKNQIFITANVG